MTSLFAERALTPEELAARVEVPRPGLWAGDAAADLRELTQDETDALIRCELLREGALGDEWTELNASIGPARFLGMDMIVGRPAVAQTQRGGIDSDPLVRLLAYRAWGDRDRLWFELRGVYAGDEVVAVANNIVAARWPSDLQIPVIALESGRPGKTITVRTRPIVSHLVVRVSDRPREPPAVKADWRRDAMPEMSRAAAIASREQFMNRVTLTSANPSPEVVAAALAASERAHAEAAWSVSVGYTVDPDMKPSAELPAGARRLGPPQQQSLARGTEPFVPPFARRRRPT